jgi:hypothetical protein
MMIRVLAGLLVSSVAIGAGCWLTAPLITGGSHGPEGLWGLAALVAAVGGLTSGVLLLIVGLATIVGLGHKL